MDCCAGGRRSDVLRGSPFIDPLLSIGISLFILFNVFRNMRESLRIILQGSPARLNVEEVKKVLLAMDEVDDVRPAYLVGGWRIQCTHHTCKLLRKEMSMANQRRLKKDIRQSLLSLGVHHCTIELEVHDEDCEMENCC